MGKSYISNLQQRMHSELDGLRYPIWETKSKLSDGKDKPEKTQDNLKDEGKMREDIRNMFTQLFTGKETVNENTFFLSQLSKFISKYMEKISILFIKIFSHRSIHVIFLYMFT